MRIVNFSNLSHVQSLTPILPGILKQLPPGYIITLYPRSGKSLVGALPSSLGLAEWHGAEMGMGKDLTITQRLQPASAIEAQRTWLKSIRKPNEELWLEILSDLKISRRTWEGWEGKHGKRQIPYHQVARIARILWEAQKEDIMRERYL
jgi:hypothetical protein